MIPSAVGTPPSKPDRNRVGACAAHLLKCVKTEQLLSIRNHDHHRIKSLCVKGVHLPVSLIDPSDDPSRIDLTDPPRALNDVLGPPVDLHLFGPMRISVDEIILDVVDSDAQIVSLIQP